MLSDASPILLSLALLVFGIANNVGAAQMGYVMPQFPAWLLYGTTIMYTAAFFAISWWRGERPFSAVWFRKHEHRHILWLALWTALNGLFFQFADPWVSGPLQQVLAACTAPLVAVTNYFVLGDRLRGRGLLGVGIVLVGLAVGLADEIKDLVHGHDGTAGDQQSNVWYWVIAFVVSVGFQAMENTYQDRAFRDPQHPVPVGVCLAWYNLYSLPLYVLTIPLESVAYLNGTDSSLSGSYPWNNQRNAWMCFFGHPVGGDGDNGRCLDNATLWPLVFVAGYIGMFLCTAILTRKHGAIFSNILSALVSPLSAMVFASDAIVGAVNASQPKATVYIGLVIVFVGVVVKGIPDADSAEHSGVLVNAEIGAGVGNNDPNRQKLLSPDDAGINGSTGNVSDGFEDDDV